MKKEKNPKDEVKKTLDILDQLERVKGSPLLFDRVQGQLKQERNQSTLVFSLPTALKAVAAIALILINIAAFRGNLMKQGSSNTLSEMIADDYGFSSSDIDLFTNNQ